MRYFLITAFFLSYILSAAQNVLILDIQAPFKLREKRFYIKDEIYFKVKGSRNTYGGKIVVIGDSALILNSGKRFDTIFLKSVPSVIIYRTNHVTNAFSKAFVMAGIGLIFIDTFNNLLHGETPYVKPNIVVTGLCLSAAGILIKIYERKKIHLGKRKNLRIAKIIPL